MLPFQHIFKHEKYVICATAWAVSDVGGLYCSLMDCYLNSYEQHNPGPLCGTTQMILAQNQHWVKKLNCILAQGEEIQRLMIHSHLLSVCSGPSTELSDSDNLFHYSCNCLTR